MCAMECEHSRKTVAARKKEGEHEGRKDPSPLPSPLPSLPCPGPPAHVGKGGYGRPFIPQKVRDSLIFAAVNSRKC